MLLRKAVLILALSFVYSSATAKWTKVYEDDMEITYVNLSSISHDNNKKQIWTLSDLKDYSIKYNSIEVRYEFQCEELDARKLFYLMYSGNMASNNLVGHMDGRLTSDPSMKWYPIIPNSKIDKLSKVACKKHSTRQRAS